jgi:hypothetical protein
MSKNPQAVLDVLDFYIENISTLGNQERGGATIKGGMNNGSSGSLGGSLNDGMNNMQLSEREYLPRISSSTANGSLLPVQYQNNNTRPIDFMVHLFFNPLLRQLHIAIHKSSSAPTAKSSSYSSKTTTHSR